MAEKKYLDENGLATLVSNLSAKMAEASGSESVTEILTSIQSDTTDIKSILNRILIAVEDIEITSGSSTSISDGVYVYVELDGAGKVISEGSWSAYKEQGYEAVGIAVVSGGHRILVSLDEPSSTMTLLESIPSGATSTDDEDVARQDYAGEYNTQGMYDSVSSHKDSGDGSYAACWCHAYSKGSKGAGSWYLPALGQLLLIYANLGEINNALTAVGGTTIAGNWYWSSTLYPSGYGAWILALSDGSVDWNSYGSNYGYVRAVSAF